MLNEAAIRNLIPHAGSMCLLDAALRWDDERVLCRARSHLRAHHPLARNGRLGVLAGVEYAAQAMALHGALTAHPGRPRSGYLASVRDIVCKVRYLDETTAEIEIEATRLLGDEERVMYRFVVRAAGVELISGRAAVRLNED